MITFYNRTTGRSQTLNFLSNSCSTPIWFVPKKDLLAIVGYAICDELEPVSSFGVWENDQCVMLTGNAQRPTPASFIYTVTEVPGSSGSRLYLNKLFGTNDDPLWVHWFRGGSIEDRIENCIDWGALEWAFHEWGALKSFPGKKCLDRIMLSLLGSEPGSRIESSAVAHHLSELLLAQGRSFTTYCERSLKRPFSELNKHPYEAIDVIRKYHIHASALSQPGAVCQSSYDEFGDDEFTACVLASMSDVLLEKLHCKGMRPERCFRTQQKEAQGSGWSALALASCESARLRWGQIDDLSKNLPAHQMNVMLELASH